LVSRAKLRYGEVTSPRFASSKIMAKVVGVDHLSISVQDFNESKQFYGKVLKFLGFKVLDEYKDAIGWTNGITRIWISSADPKGKKHAYRFGDIGFHHYAFRLGSKKDVNDLQKFLKRIGAKIVDPAGEYYENYYGVYFEDPNGLELEGMWYGQAA
jgi:catechol 2,3-dioxygenase-like lactoylglutathione lyase family enzyme